MYELNKLDSIGERRACDHYGDHKCCWRSDATNLGFPSKKAHLYQLDAPILIDAVIVATRVYLFCVGFVLQLLGKLR